MSAMKMESAVTAPVSGHIKRVVIHEGTFTFSQIYIFDNSILLSFY
jgi:pyruvate carboxylase